MTNNCYQRLLDAIADMGCPRLAENTLRSWPLNNLHMFNSVKDYLQHSLEFGGGLLPTTKYKMHIVFSAAVRVLPSDLSHELRDWVDLHCPFIRNIG